MDEKKEEQEAKDKPVEVSPKKEPKVDEKQTPTNGKASNGIVSNQPPVVTSSNGDTPVQNTQMSTGV